MDTGEQVHSVREVTCVANEYDIQLWYFLCTSLINFVILQVPSKHSAGPMLQALYRRFVLCGHWQMILLPHTGHAIFLIPEVIFLRAEYCDCASILLRAVSNIWMFDRAIPGWNVNSSVFLFRCKEIEGQAKTSKCDRCGTSFNLACCLDCDKTFCDRLLDEGYQMLCFHFQENLECKLKWTLRHMKFCSSRFV